jgi:mono/diheme cytochrome c family protein
MKKIFALTLMLGFSTSLLFAQAKKPVRKTTAKPAAGLSSSIASGNKLFTVYCVSCHQADGGGVQNLNPPLIKTKYVLGDKVKLAGIVLNGFSDNVEIDGNTYSNTMPALSVLKDQEVADILTYVRNSFGNKASAVSITDVKKARAAMKK